MRIISLKLNNFRQYYGEQCIDFSNPDDKNITIILGQNGEGKTGIFRAVIFCLFGQIFLSGEEKISRKNKNEDIIHLVNFNKLEEEKDTPIKAYVEMKFEHENQIYTMNRSILEMMEIDGTVIGEDSTDVEMSITDIHGNTNPQKIINDHDVQIILSNILDKKLKDFFLFDGEKIESLSKPNKQTREEVKSGIIKLLQIDSVTSAIELLGKIESKHRLKIKKNTSNTKLQAKRKELEDLENQKENIISDKDTLENEVIECVNLIESYKEKLSNNEHIKILYDKIDSKRKEKQSNCELLEELNSRAKSLLKNQGGNLLLEDYIIFVKNFLEQDSISNEYSTKISLDLIEELLAQKVCICGESLDENSKRFKSLQELRHKYKKSELNSFISTFRMKVNEYYSKKDQHDLEMRELLLKVDEVENKIEKIDIEISNIGKAIKGYSQNENNLKEMESYLQRYEDKLVELRIRKETIKSQIYNIDEKIKTISKEIENEEKQEKTLNNDIKKKDYVIKLKKHFEHILDTYSMEMRNKISKETTTIFKKLISDKDIDMIKNIEISEDYEIKVSGWNDNSITSDVSAGQRQIISLSFVTALAKVASGSDSKMNVPLFMDTPFGRISGVNRDNLIKTLPSLTNQWILLMTDTEFTRTEEKEFKDTRKVNNIYRLNKIKNGYTSIEKIDDIYNTSIARR
ncbi:AAA family ATPase [Paraclostridium bifermentans]|uniref:AAA family ATPase n=1 Tax=Paraclostridium bifermentans TaxID=1490 RepID=UPI0003FA21D4|nr:AAA family ATPase [Paraclostridium bifermentans]